MARILLADDDAATRDLVKRALTLDGHEVDLCQDGTEALDRGDAAEVDAAALDEFVLGLPTPPRSRRR